MLASLPADELESPVDLEHASYFLSTIDLEPSRHPTMPRWRTRLFLALSSLTADAARAFELPGALLDTSRGGTRREPGSLPGWIGPFPRRPG